MQQRSTRAQLEERWSRLGVRDEDLVPDTNGTISEPPRGLRDESPPAFHETATRPEAGTVDMPPPTFTPVPAQAPASAPDGEGVKLGPVLGMGGMGIVHLAEQPNLRREVAVKLIRPERRVGPAVTALLREAWVMGTLEHPNIPPVHLLLREQDGAPRVVMKRIEGRSWSDIIEEPSVAASVGIGDDVARDPLEFHLRVLIAVCHAVEFAHSRGVLHLDLKPDNVMVGRYGEVQVLDWGIAMSFGDRGPGWLPASKDLRGVRGTPAWLAPELAGAEADLVGPRTDVYLLGGLLHSLLTGLPRHAAEDMKEVLAEAYDSLPFTYSRDIPSELAALANRATAKDPADRPSGAEAFRQDVEAFLAHRASVRLSQEADRRTGPLLERLREGGDAAPDDQAARREFLECQFAFRQSLEIWRENPVARAGLSRLLRGMFDHALRHRQLERAAECLHALPGGDATMTQRLADATRAAAEEHERLKSFERDRDPNLHRRTRAKLALACGITFLVWNGVTGWLGRIGVLNLTLGDLVWFDTATTVVFGIVAFAVRKTLLATDFNRRVVILFGGGFIAVFVMWIGAWQLSLVRPELALTVGDVVSLSTMIFVYFVICLTFMMDARIIWLAIPAAALAALAPRATEYAFELLGFGGFMIGTALAIIWWRPKSEALRRAPTAGNFRA